MVCDMQCSEQSIYSIGWKSLESCKVLWEIRQHNPPLVNSDPIEALEIDTLAFSKRPKYFTRNLQRSTRRPFIHLSVALLIKFGPKWN